MSEKIKLTLSPVVAAYVRQGTPLEIRLAGCTAAESMSATDRVLLLFCLSKDAESAVQSAALASLKSLPVEIIRAFVESPDPHPHILNALSILCYNYHVSFQVSKISLPPEDEENQVPYDESDTATESESEDQEQVNEEDEQFLSKYKMAQLMGIAEKIKMALSGDKEWRSILVKDSNKLVSGSVVKNPRITEAEILTLVKSGIQNDEIMRLICANKEWIKNYKIRKSLIENNRTPVQNASRYLATMDVKDLAQFAKSKNIATVISTMAKRLLINKKR